MLPEFRGVSLGLGLIGIGRPWGVVNDAVPDEGTVLRLLEGAFEKRKRGQTRMALTFHVTH